MNHAMNATPPNAFDAGPLDTLRRARGHTPAMRKQPRVADARITKGTLASALAAMRAVMRRALARYRVYRDARETVRMLQGLDDRSLHDLGYHRSEIESVAVEATIDRAR